MSELSGLTSSLFEIRDGRDFHPWCLAFCLGSRERGCLNRGNGTDSFGADADREHERLSLHGRHARVAPSESQQPVALLFLRGREGRHCRIGFEPLPYFTAER